MSKYVRGGTRAEYELQDHSHHPVDDASRQPATTSSANDDYAKTPADTRFARIWWPLQICGYIFSLLLFLTIIAILSSLNDKRQPQWQLGAHAITLNAVLSVLAILSTFAMMMPVSAGLGQLKWIRFSQQSCSLADMEYIDEASRGPFGGLKIMGRFRGG